VDVLLADDFSEPANGWPQEAGDAASYLYDEGAYRITVQEKDSLFWAAPNGRFEDARIQASATLASGDAESYFGLLCRLQDARNFYYMVIRSDGSYTIGKVQDSEFRSLLPGGWDASQAIRTGSLQNQLRADCIQDRLRFYVNGELLAEVQDADFLAGKVALGAAAIGAEALDVRFDDFLVTAP